MNETIVFSSVIWLLFHLFHRIKKNWVFSKRGSAVMFWATGKWSQKPLESPPIRSFCRDFFVTILSFKLSVYMEYDYFNYIFVIWDARVIISICVEPDNTLCYPVETPYMCGCTHQKTAITKSKVIKTIWIITYIILFFLKVYSDLIISWSIWTWSGQSSIKFF